MAKIVFESQDRQTRQISNAILGPEYKIYVKRQNIVKRRSKPGQFGQKWANLGPKG